MSCIDSNGSDTAFFLGFSRSDSSGGQTSRSFVSNPATALCFDSRAAWAPRSSPHTRGPGFTADGLGPWTKLPSTTVADVVLAVGGSGLALHWPGDLFARTTKRG